MEIWNLLAFYPPHMVLGRHLFPIYTLYSGLGPTVDQLPKQKLQENLTELHIHLELIPNKR